LAIGVAVAEFPTPTGFVNDFAGVLNQAARARLEERLRTYEQATTNEIAIAIFPSLGGRTIEDVGVRLLEQWRVGKREKNNGVLIVVAVQDRRVRIEVGYGLEGQLPDATTGKIIRDVLVPHFRQGDYAGGLDTAVDELTRLTGGATTAAPRPVSRPTRTPLGGVPWQGVAFIAFLSASWWASSTSRPRCPRCHSIMRREIVGRRAFAGTAGTSVRYVCPQCSYSELKMEQAVIGPYVGGHGWSSGGFGGGGFGGFGGGSSGGGGASGSW
jgi:uncharacterized protein